MKGSRRVGGKRKLRWRSERHFICGGRKKSYPYKVPRQRPLVFVIWKKWH
jgi:hypothetical protein